MAAIDFATWTPSWILCWIDNQWIPLNESASLGKICLLTLSYINKLSQVTQGSLRENQTRNEWHAAFFFPYIKIKIVKDGMGLK